MKQIFLEYDNCIRKLILFTLSVNDSSVRQICLMQVNSTWFTKKLISVLQEKNNRIFINKNILLVI